MKEALKQAETELKTLLGEDGLKADEPMKKHTTFRTGGPADLFLTVRTEQELTETLKILKKYEVPFLIEGNGSNLLVRDKGIRGAVVKLDSKNISLNGTEIETEGGVLLSAVSRKAAEAGLTGMEFASGIPGSIGGAVVMTAGAYGGEMKDILVSVTVLTKDMEVLTLSPEALELSYRHSNVPEKGYIVLGAKLRLERGDKTEIEEKIKKLSEERREKQPVQYPNAGSTFKRPEGYFAAKLVQDAGLKGKRIGGAEVSSKHAGFVVNIENAASADILALIELCQKTVFEQFGVMLEPEVKIVGEE